MTRDQTLACLRQALSGVAGVRLALLFGSVARGAEHAQSDLDLAVDVDADVDLPGLSATLSRAVGREVELVRLNDAGVPLLDELVRDAITVHEGTPGAAARWRAHTLVDLEIDRPWFARMRDAWLRRVAERGLGDGQS
jgi:predicted nucleotidyltransferase